MTLRTALFCMFLAAGATRLNAAMLKPLSLVIQASTRQTSDTCEIFVPSAFSPDGDGINDVLCFYGPCVTGFELKVYDRWGELMFETRDLELCWDGTFKGKVMGHAVFAWTVNATLADGSLVVKKGNVTIIK